MKTPQITLNEHQNQPLQLKTTSCLQTHHTKHLSTRHEPAHDTLVLIAYSQKFYLICSRWRRSYGDLLLYLHPFALCMRAAQASLRVWLLVVPNLKFAQEKSVVRWTDRPAMTIAVDLGCKATKQTYKTWKRNSKQFFHPPPTPPPPAKKVTGATNTCQFFTRLKMPTNYLHMWGIGTNFVHVWGANWTQT